MGNFRWRIIASGEEGPGQRNRHGLVYDGEARATILFGGLLWINEQNAQMMSDTWELKKGKWMRVEGEAKPEARHRAAMAHHEAQGVTVLFGGQGGNFQMLGDTWLYRGGEWKRLRGLWRRSPSPRCGHSMAYNEDSSEVVLFGGVGPFGRTLRDTWSFDGSSWRKVKGSQPPARRYSAFAYDPTIGGCLLHGGSYDESGRFPFGDAWLYRDGSWILLSSMYETDVRDDHGLAYHRRAKTMVMLEGVRGRRGLLTASPEGWRETACDPLHPRHQCSPLAWDESLNGLVLHGGEVRHGGPQYSNTLLLEATQDFLEKDQCHEVN